MSFLGHFFVNAALAFLLTIPIVLAADLALFLSGRGSPRYIKFAFNVRRALRAMPPDTVLECRGRSVSALMYNRAHDEESVVDLYSTQAFSLLAWSTGPRSAESLHSRADIEAAVRLISLVLVSIPLLVIGLWLAFSLSWLWLLAVAILAASQIFTAISGQVFLLKYSAFSGLIPVVFLHRYHLYPISVMYIMATVLIIGSMLLLIWAQRE